MNVTWYTLTHTLYKADKDYEAGRAGLGLLLPRRWERTVRVGRRARLHCLPAGRDVMTEP